MPPGQTIRPPPSQMLSPTPIGLAASSLAWRGADSAGWVAVRNLTLEPGIAAAHPASSLAQLVIPAVIPPGPTAANQTALNGMPSQPELPRPCLDPASLRSAGCCRLPTHRRFSDQ